MAIDLTGKTKLTTITGDFGIVAVDTTEATASAKAKRIDPTAIGQKALLSINTQSGTTYTIVAADNNTLLRFTNAAGCTVTLPNSLPAGWSCMWVQKGAGAITFSPASGAVINHFQDHTTSGGDVDSIGSLVVETNTDNSSANYLLAGITAAA